MRKFLVTLLCFIAPVLIYFCALYLIDHTGYVNASVCREAAFSLVRNGDSLEFINPNYNDRGLLVERLKLLEGRHVSKAIIGNSRGLIIGEANGLKDMLNLTVAGGTIEDYSVIVDYLQLYDITVDTCFIIIDPQQLTPLKEDMFLAMHPDSWVQGKYKLKKISNVLFQDDIIKSYLQGKSFQRLTGLETTRQIRFKDGSLRYNASYTRPDSVLKATRVKSVGPVQPQFDSVKIDILENVLKNFKTSIVLRLPYHPIAYETINKFGMIDSTDMYLERNMSHYKIVGSYNPEITGHSHDSLFYDGKHPKEIVAKQIIAGIY